MECKLSVVHASFFFFNLLAFQLLSSYVTTHSFSVAL